MDVNNLEILLVEDDPDDVELIMRALKKRNLANKIFHVKDGSEALDFLFCKGIYENRSDIRPKVVLLDLNLPKISGLEVLAQIKRDKSTAGIPVVVLTSSKEEIDIKKCYELGANSYIVKPVDFEKFINVVSDLGFYWLLINEAPKDNYT